MNYLPIPRGVRAEQFHPDKVADAGAMAKLVDRASPLIELCTDDGCAARSKEARHIHLEPRGVAYLGEGDWVVQSGADVFVLSDEAFQASYSPA